ncbi:hypothetical protein [Derxia lacustris]|uniref:hypothetical protein n=1 Tax=Derxia lacustris TaxID=764842 RepID=UPI000A174279|nr:hypothetical protein [Derxia lacustris]
MPSYRRALQGTRTVVLRDLLGKTPLSALELMQPRLVEQIALLWGHPEMGRFFELLTYASESAQPLGKLEMEEIAFLQALHLKMLRLGMVAALPPAGPPRFDATVTLPSLRPRRAR